MGPYSKHGDTAETFKIYNKISAKYQKSVYIHLAFLLSFFKVSICANVKLGILILKIEDQMRKITCKLFRETVVYNWISVLTSSMGYEAKISINF